MKSFEWPPLWSNDNDGQPKGKSAVTKTLKQLDTSKTSTNLKDTYGGSVCVKFGQSDFGLSGENAVRRKQSTKKIQNRDDRGKICVLHPLENCPQRTPVQSFPDLKL